MKKTIEKQDAEIVAGHNHDMDSGHDVGLILNERNKLCEAKQIGFMTII